MINEENEYLAAVKDYVAISGKTTEQVIASIVRGDGGTICTVRAIVEANRSNWGVFDPLPTTPIIKKREN